jgi:hypothetical protein
MQNQLSHGGPDQHVLARTNLAVRRAFLYNKKMIYCGIALGQVTVLNSVWSGQSAVPSKNSWAASDSGLTGCSQLVILFT